MLHSEGLKNSLDIESKLFLVLFVFCSGAVPSYSSHSQNTKFISLSQSLPACRNLYFNFFYTLKRSCRQHDLLLYIWQRQNLTHYCTTDFERRMERSTYYEFRRNSFKYVVSFDDVPRPRVFQPFIAVVSV